MINPIKLPIRAYIMFSKRRIKAVFFIETPILLKVPMTDILSLMIFSVKLTVTNTTSKNSITNTR